MKILHIIPNLGIGGTEKILLELCRALEGADYQNRVVCLKSGSETMEELRKIPVLVTALNSADSFLGGVAEFPKLLFRLKKIISDFSPHIVHTWLTRANVIGRMAAKGAGVPVVISGLRVMEDEKKYHLWAEFLTHRLSDVVTVNCTALKEFAIQSIGIPGNKIALIPNGIDIDKKKIDSLQLEVLREKWARKDEFIIGTMGRLHKQKGMDIFIKAARSVIERFPKTRFLIAGDGPEKVNLRSLVARMDLQSNVTFCGWITPNSEFLSILDLFVLASRWEGMPNVILESMLMEIPIVATTVGGTPDLIENRKEGLLIHPGDVKECADGMIAYMVDAELRKKTAQAAYRKVTEEFSLKKMIDGYRALYESFAKN